MAAQCSRDAINTVGAIEHGPTFRALQFAICTTLGDWDDKLGYHLDKRIPRRLLQEYELAEEDGVLSRIPLTHRMEALRAPNPNDPIRVYGGTVEFDIERLRTSSRFYKKYYPAP
ncbi:hypothetical protein SLS62_001212 [Diatrype stigma]|uniref:Uncharacterized protein n=1 Tax=Diatrype stigma TaxID=117547 RepID=A0AAN9YWA0_9PEZI